MGEMIDLQCPDARSAAGYLARSPTKSAGGVVVIQEWWGLNDQIKTVSDRFAATGFDALAPDLYGGRVTGDADEAGHMMDGLDWQGAVQNEVRAAVQLLKETNERVAVLGFCMGGALTIIAGVDTPEVDAAVCFYGIPPHEQADPAKIRVPFQGHFAERDDWCTPQSVDALEASLNEAKVIYELYRYAAAHAFFNQEQPVYDAHAAGLAWDRSIAFLTRVFGQG